MTGNIGFRARVLAVLAAAAVVAGCSGAAATPAGPTLDIVTVTPRPTQADGQPQAVATMPSWFATQMTDVNSGRTFTINDFKGKVVLVEAMATWCPSCQGEMSQVQELLKNEPPGTDLVAVSLDVDPNEDAGILQKYASQNGFTWLVAIAPPSVVQFLTDNYDQSFLNPPLQPMLFIDRQQGVWGLPTGSKTWSQLKATLDPYLKQ